jgi:uncharacterized integral membrane protein
MRVFIWLLRAFVFFALFAFALNNQHNAVINGFFGTQWHAPMVIVVLAAFAAGSAIGVIAMVPGWWRHRRGARRNAPAPASPPPTPAANPAAQAPREML